MPAQLSIIIVNWKSKDYVRKCLASLQGRLEGISHEIIVVDGGSFDGCGEMLAREYPSVIFVQSPTNVGFARANNLGFQRASGEFVWFLNPDTEVTGDGVQTLLGSFDGLPDAGLLGGRLLNTDGSLQTSCVQAIPTPLNQVLDSEFLRRVFPNSRLWATTALMTAQRPTVVEAVCGACMMMRREVFRRVGGFSSHYFMYGEDLDLCFKVRAAGLQVYYVPGAAIVHHGGGSSKGEGSKFSVVMMREAMYRFLRHHRGWLSAMSYRLGMMLNAGLRLVLILPLLLVRSRSVVQHGSGSLRKWLGILRWSIGLESWSQRCGAPAGAGAEGSTAVPAASLNPRPSASIRG